MRFLSNDIRATVNDKRVRIVDSQFFEMLRINSEQKMSFARVMIDDLTDDDSSCNDCSLKTFNLFVVTIFKFRRSTSTSSLASGTLRSFKRFSFKYVTLVRFERALTNALKLNENEADYNCECNDLEFRRSFARCIVLSDVVNDACENCI